MARFHTYASKFNFNSNISMRPPHTSRVYMYMYVATCIHMYVGGMEVCYIHTHLNVHTLERHKKHLDFHTFPRLIYDVRQTGLQNSMGKERFAQCLWTATLDSLQETARPGWSIVADLVSTHLRGPWNVCFSNKWHTKFDFFLSLLL